MVHDAVAHLPREVEPATAVLEVLDDPKALLVVPERALEERSERLLPEVPERRVAEVVAEGDRLGEVLVQPERAGGGPGDLAHLQRVREPDAVVVALGGDEHLGLVLQAPERLRMDDAVAIALEARAQGVRRLVALAALARRRPASRTATGSRARSPRCARGGWARADSTVGVRRLMLGLEAVRGRTDAYYLVDAGGSDAEGRSSIDRGHRGAHPARGGVRQRGRRLGQRGDGRRDRHDTRGRLLRRRPRRGETAPTGGTGATGETGAAAGATVALNNFLFQPADLEVASGTDLEVVNANSRTPHTFTVVGEDVDVELAPLTSETTTIDLAAGQLRRDLPVPRGPRDDRHVDGHLRNPDLDQRSNSR